MLDWYYNLHWLSKTGIVIITIIGGGFFIFGVVARETNWFGSVTTKSGLQRSHQKWEKIWKGVQKVMWIGAAVFAIGLYLQERGDSPNCPSSVEAGIWKGRWAIEFYGDLEINSYFSSELFFEFKNNCSQREKGFCFVINQDNARIGGSNSPSKPGREYDFQTVEGTIKFDSGSNGYKFEFALLPNKKSFLGKIYQNQSNAKFVTCYGEKR